MAIILVGGQKGGTGKTTIATNMAVKLKKDGLSVKIVDADPQASASLWSDTRNEEDGLEHIPCSILKGRIQKDIREEAKHYEVIIIDAGGADSQELRSAMLVADHMIIPVRPSMFDSATLFKVDQMVEEALVNNEKLRARILINGASTNPVVKEDEEAKDLYEGLEHLEVMNTVIKDRKTYRDVVKSGRSILEEKPVNKKAIDEFQLFMNEVLNG